MLNSGRSNFDTNFLLMVQSAVPEWYHSGLILGHVRRKLGQSVGFLRWQIRMDGA